MNEHVQLIQIVFDNPVPLVAHWGWAIGEPAVAHPPQPTATWHGGPPEVYYLGLISMHNSIRIKYMPQSVSKKKILFLFL